jgi:predicted N-formylglutamate amidohydrolase
LAGHRGWDPGAWSVAQQLSRAIGCELFGGEVTRLLVDLNRTAGHRRLFSEYSSGLALVQRTALIERYHRPYVGRVRGAVQRFVDEGRQVLHLSIHSFTPVLDGKPRNAAIGLLYDPARGPEKQTSGAFRSALCTQRSDWHVRRNYPYAGTANGLATSLRKDFGAECYMGIELEMNQACVLEQGRKFTDPLRRAIVEVAATLDVVG